MIVANGSVAERPTGSTAPLEYAPTPYDDRDQYDDGRHETVDQR